MIIQAIEEFDISTTESYMIGDSKRDMEAAFAAGIEGIKIKKNTDITWAVNEILGNIIAQ